MTADRAVNVMMPKMTKWSSAWRRRCSIHWKLALKTVMASAAVHSTQTSTCEQTHKVSWF